MESEDPTPTTRSDRNHTLRSVGRFYQTDPIGFEGDPLNLYRFSGSNPLLGGDPMGLDGEDAGGEDQVPLDFNFSVNFGLSDSSNIVDTASSISGFFGDTGDISATPWTSYSESLSVNLSAALPPFSSGSSMFSSAMIIRAQNTTGLNINTGITGPFITRPERIRQRITELALESVFTPSLREQWLVSVRKDNFPSGKDKCNKFVFDILTAAGVHIDLLRHPMFGLHPPLLGYGHPGALLSSDYGNPNIVMAGFRIANNPMSGDIVGLARPNGTGHVGIVVGPGQTVSSSTMVDPLGLIVISNWGIEGNEGVIPVVFRRYYGND